MNKFFIDTDIVVIDGVLTVYGIGKHFKKDKSDVRSATVDERRVYFLTSQN